MADPQETKECPACNSQYQILFFHGNNLRCRYCVIKRKHVQCTVCHEEIRSITRDHPSIHKKCLSTRKKRTSMSDWHLYVKENYHLLPDNNDKTKSLEKLGVMWREHKSKSQEE